MAIIGGFNRAQLRQKSAVDLTPKVTADLAGKDEFTAKIVKMFKEIRRWELRQEIAAAAAPIVVEAARKQARASFSNTKIHYTYNTPKLSRRLKAPKGKGRKTGTYYPGNLERSILEIGERRSRYKKKTYKVIIGPYYRGRGPGAGKAKDIFNSMSKINGYYAHMVYGSAVAFRNRIMVPAFNNVKGQVLNIMKAKAAEVIVREGFKVNLDVIKSL